MTIPTHAEGGRSQGSASSGPGTTVSTCSGSRADQGETSRRRHRTAVLPPRGPPGRRRAARSCAAVPRTATPTMQAQPAASRSADAAAIRAARSGPDDCETQPSRRHQREPCAAPPDAPTRPPGRAASALGRSERGTDTCAIRSFARAELQRRSTCRPPARTRSGPSAAGVRFAFRVGKARVGACEVVGDEFTAVRTEAVAPHRCGPHGREPPCDEHRADTRTATAAHGSARLIGQALRSTSSACSRSAGYLLSISIQLTVGRVREPERLCVQPLAFETEPGSARRGSAP